MVGKVIAERRPDMEGWEWIKYNVWETPWILDKRTTITPFSRPDSNMNLRVADLIDFSSGE